MGFDGVGLFRPHPCFVKMLGRVEEQTAVTAGLGGPPSVFSPSSGDGSPVSTQDDVGVTMWLQEACSGWKALVIVYSSRL